MPGIRTERGDATPERGELGRASVGKNWVKCGVVGWRPLRPSPPERHPLAPWSAAFSIGPQAFQASSVTATVTIHMLWSRHRGCSWPTRHASRLPSPHHLLLVLPFDAGVQDAINIMYVHPNSVNCATQNIVQVVSMGAEMCESSTQSQFMSSVFAIS
jgi:hypothetical protein